MNAVLVYKVVVLLWKHAWNAVSLQVQSSERQVTTEVAHVERVLRVLERVCAIVVLDNRQLWVLIPLFSVQI
jgi:hypothetical protein